MIFSPDLYEAIESKDYSRSLNLLGKIYKNTLCHSQKWVYLQTYRWILDQMGIPHSIQFNQVSFGEIQWDLIPISLHSYLKKNIEESYKEIWATYDVFYRKKLILFISIL